MPRLFTGLAIPESIRTRLMLIKAGLTGSTWISPENYHITLRFVGDIEASIADEFSYELQHVHCEPFPIRITGLGSFGGSRPRTIWADIEAGDELRTLQKHHESIARSVGLPPESRNYTPHITLARLRGASSFEVARFLESFSDFTSEWFQIDSFLLYSSRSNRGGGPYAVEAEYPLENW